MCSPTAIVGAVTTAITATTAAAEIVQENKNAKINSQIALTNAKNAQNEAKRQQQLGIEEAREEKIKGQKNANLLSAQNAANGFDVTSGNNLLNYQDTYSQGYQNANKVQEEYNEKSQDYYNQANAYLAESGNIISKYNSSAFSTALGATNKVAKIWYPRALRQEFSEGVY